MKLYADTPGRRTRQIVADLLVVLWTATWIWVGQAVHDQTLALAEPGRETSSAATSMAGGLRDAGGSLDGLPLVGDEVARPFQSAADASDRIAAAGDSTVRAVERLAWWLGVSLAVIPVLVVAAIHLPVRWRFARQATAGAVFIDAAEDLDLFALRALARQPMHVLARVSEDPSGAWRRGDAAVVRRLAELELRDCGLRPPPTRESA